MKRTELKPGREYPVRGVTVHPYGKAARTETALTLKAGAALKRCCYLCGREIAKGEIYGKSPFTMGPIYCSDHLGEE